MAAGQYLENTHPLSCLVITITLLFFLTHFATPLNFSYQQFSDNDQTLNLEGDVYHDNGFLQLTRSEKDSLGRVTYYKPLHLWDRESGKVTDFSTHFSFIINSPNKTHHGDGITFFLAQPNFPLPVPRDGSGIGLVSRHQLEDSNYTTENPFVAVEFDTFWNEWDPPYDHVGIDVKSIETAYTTEWFSIKDGRRYDADISYNSSSNNLTVSFTGYQNNMTVEQYFSDVVNLRDVLPEWAEFGFSSATGLFYEIHTLCSWSFNSSLDMEDQNDGRKAGAGLAVGLSIAAGILIIGLGLTWLFVWKMKKRRIDQLDFDLTMDNDFASSAGPKIRQNPANMGSAPLPTPPPQMSEPTYHTPLVSAPTSSSSLSTSSSAFGSNQTQSSSNNSFMGPSKSRTAFEVVSPSADLKRTY